MKFNEYFNLGAVSKVFSFKGEVTLRFDVNYPEILSNLSSIFIEQNGNLIPYIIEELTFQKKNFARVKLKGIDNEEAAKKIVRANIYLPDSFLPKLNDDEFYFHEIHGYSILNQDDDVIGEVSDVFDLPSNPMIETIIDSKDVLIPLKLMISIDKRNKKIKLEIPEGLLSI